MIPPPLVLLALVAIAVPAALRAASGRPRFELAATLLSAVAVVVAQAAGELAGTRVGTLGDTQLALAAVASLVACALVAIVEGPGRVPSTR